MPILPGHQRNVSQGQHLIVDRTEDDEDLERGVPSLDFTEEGIYPGGSPRQHEPSRPQNMKARGFCSDPHIRDNSKVILLSFTLAIAGAALLIFGTLEFFKPDEGSQGWVYLFAGFIAFVPGAYHVYYIICTICGRSGYSFDKLPTFSR